MDDFPRVDIISSIDPLGHAGVMLIIDREYTEFKGDLGDLDWGEAIGRILMSGIKIARESFTVECIYMSAVARERLSFGKVLANRAHGCLSERPKCDILCGDWNMICHREDSRAENLSGDKDRETHSAVLEELMGAEAEYVDDWRQRWPNSRIYTH